MTATELTPLPVVAGVEFRPYPEHPVYAVGDDGSVWSQFSCRGRFPEGWRRISPYRRPYGARYMVVCLRENEGKGRVICRYVHRMVLETFVGPCPDGMLGCHNDGNTANNRRTNLRWDTPAANMADKDRHGTARRGVDSPNALMDSDRLLMVFLLASVGLRQDEIGQVVGLTQTGVSQVLRGDTYTTETEQFRRVRDALRDIIDLEGI